MRRTISQRRAMTLIGDDFDRRGWRYVSRAALDIVEQIDDVPARRNYTSLARLVPRVALSQDGITRVDVEDALRQLLNDVTVTKQAAS